MNQVKKKCPLALSVISAVIAFLSIMTYILPVTFARNVFRLLSAEHVMRWVMLINGEFAHDFFYKVFPIIMYVSVALLAVWAILSLIRLKAAGIIGLIASIIHCVIGAAWFYYALVYAPEMASYNMPMTPVPYLMPVIGIAGIVLAILQIKKSK